jgi:hypothetical protein
MRIVMLYICKVVGLYMLAGTKLSELPACECVTAEMLHFSLHVNVLIFKYFAFHFHEVWHFVSGASEMILHFYFINHLLD